ncbi:hypothetical protein D9758_000456 [Tetrapyrgos nigripes]|uniref:Chromatin remodeling factor mit1 n=1 Tax=Tetrapyrgos nigripes TaxID=182062 RepID=A0A8H5LYR0_9AGAR|nr:hypothetical protein D9758_000456 [Tetrapyrgos nigripes]
MDDTDPPDPLLLLSPVTTVQTIDQNPPNSHNRRQLYVSVPSLPEAKKSLYSDMPEEGYVAEPETVIDEIVGDVQDKKKGLHLYYGRRAGELLRGYTENTLRKRHSHLLESYAIKREYGLVPKKFDPSGDDVDPDSRLSIFVSIDKKSKKADYSYRSGSESTFTGSDESSELTDVDDDNFSDGTHRATRRSSRTRRQYTLPFSPKKTRAQRLYLPQDSDVSDDEDASPKSRRRSTRNKKGRVIKFDDGTETQDSDYQISRVKRSKKTKGKKSFSESARPAYGHFRSIEDLEYDSDEETRVLRAHRNFCEKCLEPPATRLLQVALKRTKKGKKKKSEEDDFEDTEDDEERAKSLGGWVQCMKCPVAAHWRCLASTQQNEILKATQIRDRAKWLKEHEGQDVDVAKDGPRKRPGLQCDQTTEFICGSCTKGGLCMGCKQTALEPVPVTAPESNEQGVSEGAASASGGVTEETSPQYKQPAQLLFRCRTCKRLAHYGHLALPDLQEDELLAAERLQHKWLCNDCHSYQWELDKILAWRPYPPNAVEPPHSGTEQINYKSSLPREYLVKWQGRSYRRASWVPHMWLLSTKPSKLKNFLTVGSRIELLGSTSDGVGEFDDQPSNIFDDGDILDSSASRRQTTTTSAPSSMPDAENRIPLDWKTVDRVLSVVLRRPHPRKARNRKEKKRNRNNVIMSDGEEEAVEVDEEAEKVYQATFQNGELPPEDFTETIYSFEARTGRTFGEDPEDIQLIVWAFIKWVDLGYGEATWDSPPLHSDPTYHAFQGAFRRFVASREVRVTKHGKNTVTELDKRTKDEYRRTLTYQDVSQVQLGQDPSLKLMDFQLDGLNWLCDNWWNKQPCILADDMGLGKTVQVSTFIGRVIGEFQAAPALIVVPNSTITNWIREFERWAPKLRVVPFYGESTGRKVIKEFELFHEDVEQGFTRAKFHVLVTTFETMTNTNDFAVFKSQPRWEILVVDEGQRLKSDSSLLFRKLNELNTLHRVIMTGTPLNNTIRELFNLMHFLDPSQWQDLEALDSEYAELNEDLVKQLHGRLRPYLLRRIKNDVLDLPPKNEVILPVSMTKLQKEVYRSILSRNLEILGSLTKPGSEVKGSARKTKITNLLMELRKCLQHPYLCDEAIEPRDLSPQETHGKLIDASAKLRLLKSLLPKLKSRGHRVLLFSQFVIALNIVEDFLVGENYKFLRLDGNTPGFQRQKDIDEFNRPGSDVFVYLLTTRAGGVGINLATADTVIVLDPDFNPHQDMQAIARSHRFGQTKKCLVFKMMVKESAEERIMQMGKKKLALDHLIVQKINDEESVGDTVQSILTYGAQALFESDEGSAKDITYTDNDLDSLIDKTEKEGQVDDKAQKEGFSFAKIWTADKNELEEIGDDDQGQGDSWAQTLQKINAERERVKIQEEALSGRGARRKAAYRKENMYIEDSPVKKNKKSKSQAVSNSDGESAYQGSDINSYGSDVESLPNAMGVELKELQNTGGRQDYSAPSEHRGHKAQVPTPASYCNLCEQYHGDGECSMLESSENLVEYREMLMLHAEDESWENRSAAIQAIDELLYRRGDGHLLAGQPLHLVQGPLLGAKKEKAKIPGQTPVQIPAKTLPAAPRPPPQIQYVAGPSLMTNTAPKTTIPSNGVPRPQAQHDAGRPSLTKNTTPQSVVSNSGLMPRSQAQVQNLAGPSRPTHTAPQTANTSMGVMVPQHPPPAQPVAGTSTSQRLPPPHGSKRPSSPASLPQAPNKRPKKAEDTCAVCKGPLHNLGQCPVIAQGPER